MAVEPLNDSEKKFVSEYFTNVDKQVFVLTNLPEVVKGALFARYSRNPSGLRETLFREFMKNPDMEFDAIVNLKSNAQEEAIKRAERFYERVLIGFGDDSVAELAFAHVAVEGVSNIVSKILEDSRIGISPLEKSTRYVYFNEKVNGEYLYVKEPDIMSSEFKEEYIELNDFLFETYSTLIYEMEDYFKSLFSKEGDVSDRAYNTTIRAKTCDTIRGILPASTKTNLGLAGNGRAFEYLIVKLRSSPLKEAHTIADQLEYELRKVIPPFVKRASEENRYGKAAIDHMRNMDTVVQRWASKLGLNQEPNQTKTYVKLISSHGSEDDVIAAMLFEGSLLSMDECYAKVKAMSIEDKRSLINEYLSKRTNRRHRPGRAFENVYMTFEITANYGIFRDLQRHRMLTQRRQLLTTFLGYDVPKHIRAAGKEDVWRNAMKRADELFRKIYAKMPHQAQYVVPFAYRVRWYFTMNLREVYHLCELRASKQGHPDYRRIAQQIYTVVKEKFPLLVSAMNVDMNDYELSRLDAEKKIDEKLKSIAEREEKKEGES